MTPGDVFKRDILDPYPKSPPFWKPYDKLNNVTIPDLQAIKNYQLSKIQMFEQQSMEKLKVHSEKINKLFTSGDVNRLPSEKDEINQKMLDEVILDIVNQFNSMRGIEYKKDEYGLKYYQYMSDFAKKLVGQLNEINARLGAENMIPSQYLEQLSKLIDNCNMNSLDTSAVEEWMRQLSNFQGALIEDLAVEWLKEQNLPDDIQILNTGSVVLNTSRENRHSGQLIQDLMVLEVSSPEILETPVQYRPIGEKEYIPSTLGQLLDDIKKANGSSKKISINDEAYDVLQGLSAMNIQAKSGKKQIPWNKNASTSVALSEFQEEKEDNLSLSVKETFQLLHSLEHEGGPDEDNSWLIREHRHYNLLADYGLATVLIKVLHLDGPEGNQYLITPLGFTLYSTRLQQLMKEYKSYIRIVGNVNIHESLSTPYTIGMQGLK